MSQRRRFCLSYLRVHSSVQLIQSGLLKEDAGTCEPHFCCPRCVAALRRSGFFWVADSRQFEDCKGRSSELTRGLTLVLLSCFCMLPPRLRLFNALCAIGRTRKSQGGSRSRAVLATAHTH
eukprot:564522-Amphidinium_carterae.2